MISKATTDSKELDICFKEDLKEIYLFQITLNFFVLFYADNNKTMKGKCLA